jgi:DNA-binding NtrC family response regulator
LFAKAVSQLQKVAGSETPILIEGETGTGKELAAAFVHAHSSRRAGPFVTVDCTVLNEDLFESELFGHERGAFTGSVGTRKGLFEIADGGTLFMDELGEMPLAMQSKLLRALESGTFRRVGSNKTQRSDVRLVSATNRSLSGCVSKGDFRQDLFYRVAVFTLTLPPLRDRDGDLLILAATLLKSINRTAGLEYSITPQALQRLAMHPFPGNVRELKNILQLAAALCDGDRIDACDIQIGPTAQHGLIDSVCEAELMEQATGYADEDRPALEALESDYVAGLLAKHNGSRAEVAEKMGISERTLYRKLKRYGLN